MSSVLSVSLKVSLETKKKTNTKDIKILRVYIFNNMKKVAPMCVITVFPFARCFDKRESY